MSETEIIDAGAVEVEEVQNLPAVRASEAIVARDEISVAEVVAQHDKIIAVMSAVMKEGIHYGKIPGISKPTLLKPGAESINVALRLAPDYASDKVFTDDGHLTVTAKCTLRHITTGLVIASGEGLCSSREQKYAYRQGGRSCPACGAAAIKKSKYPPRENDWPGASPSDPPGWFCFKKLEGCGANFRHDEEAIVSQTEGRVANPDLPDTWNTVLKMADKRALVAAVLNGTAASDVFTQDVEETGGGEGDPYGHDPGPSQPAAEKRVEGPKPLAKPRSFPKVTEMIAAYDAGTVEMFNRFGTAARTLLYADDDPLSDEQKRELLSVSADAALALRNSVDAAGFPPPSVEDIRKAWASVLDGRELAVEEPASA